MNTRPTLAFLRLISARTVIQSREHAWLKAKDVEGGVAVGSGAVAKLAAETTPRRSLLDLIVRSSHSSTQPLLPHSNHIAIT